MIRQAILSSTLTKTLRKERVQLNKVKKNFTDVNGNLTNLLQWLKQNDISVDYTTKTSRKETAVVISTYLLPQYKKEKLYNFANDKANKYKYLFLHGQSQYAYEQKKLAIVINSKKTLEHLFQVSNETANISNRLNLINQMLSA